MCYNERTNFERMEFYHDKKRLVLHAFGSSDDVCIRWM